MSGLYALSVVLLLSVGAAVTREFVVPAAQGSVSASTLGTITVILVDDMLYGFSMLQGTLPPFEACFLGLNIMAFLPPAAAIALTFWAARQPSAPASSAG